MKYLKNNNWIFALIILLFISASYYQGNVRWYRMYNRGGLSVGMDTVSGTNIVHIDSITGDGTYFYTYVDGDTLSSYSTFAVLDNIGDVAVLKHPTAVTKTASDTLVTTEDNNYIYMDGSTADTLWIDTNANQAFTLQSGVTVFDDSTEDMYIAPLAGVTLNGATDAIKISGENKAVVLIYKATNSWNVIGAI